jgi:hypothetical protein
MTLGEFECGIRTRTGKESETAQPAGRVSLVSEELYLITRALLRLTGPGEVVELLVGFVTAVGGSVHFGDFPPTPGMIAIDLSVADAERLYAVAETVSVAGMIFEQSLPSLVEDARLALRHQYPAST